MIYQMNFEGLGCLEIARKSLWKSLNIQTLHCAAPHRQLAASPKCEPGGVRGAHICKTMHTHQRSRSHSNQPESFY